MDTTYVLSAARELRSVVVDVGEAEWATVERTEGRNTVVETEVSFTSAIHTARHAGFILLVQQLGHIHINVAVQLLPITLAYCSTALSTYNF